MGLCNFSPYSTLAYFMVLSLMDVLIDDKLVIVSVFLCGFFCFCILYSKSVSYTVSVACTMHENENVALLRALNKITVNISTPKHILIFSDSKSSFSALDSCSSLSRNHPYNILLREKLID